LAKFKAFGRSRGTTPLPGQPGFLWRSLDNLTDESVIPLISLTC
jgi:hypothetical protein